MTEKQWPMQFRSGSGSISQLLRTFYFNIGKEDIYHFTHLKCGYFGYQFILIT